MKNLYNFVYDEVADAYIFITKNTILYRVYFLKDETLSSISGVEIPNVFQLVVEKKGEATEPYDLKVSKTIEFIIIEFFTKRENSIIYICSDTDEKAKQRHITFSRWYEKSTHKEDIIKLDNNVNIEDTIIYTSFIFHKENKNSQILIDIYKQIENVLNEK